ncbi:hypothetical protein EEQ99_09090 [Rhizobium anhuiense]|uniref:Uncharacterized protein n=1 Tax=Rhizobium anhuiense TaxID=1184720 RepID=A0A432NUU0_9HYPH|nr:hypothetical protein EEQ99_09090 [Rhizobium anhuiense]
MSAFQEPRLRQKQAANCPSSGCAGRAAPHPAAATDRGRATGLDPSFGPTLAGRRDEATTSPPPAHVSQGTSPLPVKTGRG